MIYDYLLYKTYKLAKLAKNEDDDAIWLGIMIVGSCLIFNIATIILLVDKIGFVKYGNFDNKYRYIIGALMTLGVGFYYFHKKRYKKILKRYESKEKYKKGIHPLIPVLVLCIVSILLLIFTAMYRNGDGIFS